MSYYAKVVDNKVIKVICADSTYFNDFVDTTPGLWLETYKDASQRYHFAGVGHLYDPIDDAFYPPQPHSGWTLDKSDYSWNAPTPMPTDNDQYGWDEDTESWVVRS